MPTVLQLFRRPHAGSFSVERLYEDVRGYLPEDLELEILTNRFYSSGLWRRLYDSVSVSWRQADVYHVTGDVHYLTYFLDRRRTLLTILDCIPLDRHSGVKFWLLWLFWYWLPEKRCTAIVVISQATRDRLLHYIRCAPEKIHVIYCNVSDEFQPNPKEFNVVRPRILQVGVKANKNLERHVAALAGLECELVIIGGLSERQRDLLAQYKICYENYVSLSREALLEQYARSDMLLFASTYEGFGLPIVEAQAIGRPVVTSDLLSMPEVAGNAACLVDPLDVKSIRTGVRRVIEERDYRENLVRLGFENVRRFRVREIARQYAALYRQIHQSVTRKQG